MRILVIGGTRFIGPAVVRRLVEAGHEVAVLHRGRRPIDLPPGVEEVLADRKEIASLAPRLRALEPRVVVDMIPYTEDDARGVMETFRGVAERVVAVSSGDVYRAFDGLRRVSDAPPAAAPLNEDAPLREVLYPQRTAASTPDQAAYGYDKIPAERAFLADADLPGTILRLPVVYGPGDYVRRPFEYLKRMDDGRPAILLAEGQAGWRWTRGYVDDVAAAIVRAVLDPRAAGRVYNAGEPDALTEAEWVRAIGRAAGWEGEIVVAPRDRLPAHVLPEDYDWRHHLHTHTGRIRRELDFAETIDRHEALRRTIEWERANPPERMDPAHFDYAAEDAALREIRGRG
jgi:nucleoside-diphosphate-sugar epimerase